MLGGDTIVWVPRLPIDVWAHVACFIESENRVSTFMILRRALFIPTYGSFHETMMRFLERAAAEDNCANKKAHALAWPERPFWPDQYLDTLSEMGFEEQRSVRALVMSGGDLLNAIHFIAIGRV